MKKSKKGTDLHLQNDENDHRSSLNYLKENNYKGKSRTGNIFNQSQNNMTSKMSNTCLKELARLEFSNSRPKIKDSNDSSFENVTNYI